MKKQIIFTKVLFLLSIVTIIGSTLFQKSTLIFADEILKTDEKISKLLYNCTWVYNAEASQKNAKTENASLAVTHFKNSTFEFFKNGTFLGTSRVKGKFSINSNNRILVDLPDNKKILFEIDTLNNLVGNMIWREKTLINPTYSIKK